MVAKNIVGIPLVIALAGCGGAEESASTPATADAEATGSESAAVVASTANVCDLASNEEVGAAVGNDVAGVDIDRTLCEYAPTSGTIAGDRIAVDVFRNEASSPTCDLEFGGVSAARGQPVDGVGSVAWWRGDRSPRQLYICGGGAFVAITIYHPSRVTDQESRAAAEQIGALVLSRL